MRHDIDLRLGKQFAPTFDTGNDGALLCPGKIFGITIHLIFPDIFPITSDNSVFSIRRPTNENIQLRLNDRIIFICMCQRRLQPESPAVIKPDGFINF
jgi:hypothetical protein